MARQLPDDLNPGLLKDRDHEFAGARGWRLRCSSWVSR
jgi:hypothetical protein